MIPADPKMKLKFRLKRRTYIILWIIAFLPIPAHLLLAIYVSQFVDRTQIASGSTNDTLYFLLGYPFLQFAWMFVMTLVVLLVIAATSFQVPKQQADNEDEGV